MKRIIKVLSGLLCAGLVVGSNLYLMNNDVRADGIAIDSTNFPDEIFREYISDNCDTDRDGYLQDSEIKEVTLLGMNHVYHGDRLGGGYFKIKDLTGIEYFYNLKGLFCSDNGLTKLDVSKNKYLEELDCSKNKLSSINLENNPLLKILYCADNQLTDLDVSKHTALTELDYSGNNLSNVDLSNNSLIEVLHCSNNQIRNLDVSTKALLRDLDCSKNYLTELDVSKNPELSMFFCGENQLTELDLSHNKKMYWLKCEDNKLTDLDVSLNPGINLFDCRNNNLDELDITNNEIITYLYCDGNQFTVLDISNCPYLVECYNDYADTVNIEDDSITFVHYGSEQYCYILLDRKVTIITDGNSSVPTTPSVTPTPGPILTPVAVPTFVPNAERSVGDFADRCYEVALGREADEAGYKAWVDQLNNGQACGAQVGYGFIFSEEYMSKNTTNEQFVNDLYAMYFGREADDAGFDYWNKMLGEGATREEVFAGFANSTEFYNLCDTYGVVCGTYLIGVPNNQQGGVNSFVARLYKICLNRMPDQGGQLGWVQQLANGTQTGAGCAYGFVFSPEFTNLNLKDEEFVAYMYLAFFGREADAEGYSSWVSQLQQGTASREDVFNGFTGSAEFANLCASYGINA